MIATGSSSVGQTNPATPGAAHRSARTTRTDRRTPTRPATSAIARASSGSAAGRPAATHAWARAVRAAVRASNVPAPVAHPQPRHVVQANRWCAAVVAIGATGPASTVGPAISDGVGIGLTTDGRFVGGSDKTDAVAIPAIRIVASAARDTPYRSRACRAGVPRSTAHSRPAIAGPCHSVWPSAVTQTSQGIAAFIRLPPAQIDPQSRKRRRCRWVIAWVAYLLRSRARRYSAVSGPAQTPLTAEYLRARLFSQADRRSRRARRPPGGSPPAPPPTTAAAATARPTPGRPGTRG